MRISDWSSDVCSSDLAAGVNPWLVEVVAGIIEAGETPADVVQREAVEEAGCSVTALHPIGTFFVTPGGSSETVAIYCGRTDSSGAGGIQDRTSDVLGKSG